LNALIAEAERVSRESAPPIASEAPPIPVVIPRTIPGTTTQKLSLHLGRDLSSEAFASIMAKVTEYAMQGIECSVTIGEETTPPVPSIPEKSADLSQVLEALGKLRVGKVLSKRNKDKMTEVMTHLVTAQVIIQELLDSSYVAGDDEDEAEPPTEGATSPNGAPAGASTVDKSNPYDSEAFAMLTKATEQIQQLERK
jgi:hypothetical protein